MKNRYTLACLLLAVSLSVSAFALTLQQNNAVASGVDAGQLIGDFKLPDAASGTGRSLASLKGANGTVLIFVSTQCPVSNAYNRPLAKVR